MKLQDMRRCASNLLTFRSFASYSYDFHVIFQRNALYKSDIYIYILRFDLYRRNWKKFVQMVERIGGIRDGLISSSRSKQSMIELLGEKINWRWKGGKKKRLSIPWQWRNRFDLDESVKAGKNISTRTSYEEFRGWSPVIESLTACNRNIGGIDGKS